MHTLALSTIARWTSGCLYGADQRIDSITHDTRQPVRGALYVALCGDRFDGHTFVAAAAERGAAGVLVERKMPALDLPQIVVADTQRALADIAKALQQTRTTRIFALTGSNGKTTVKTMVLAILTAAARTRPRVVYATPGNYNNEIGLPMAVINAPEDVDDAVYEMGAGKPGDIRYLTQIIQPSIALVNTVAPAHLERLGTLLSIAQTKGAIYSALAANGTAVINADDAFGQWFMQTCVPPGRAVLRFGLDASAEVSARQLRLAPQGTHFEFTSPFGNIAVALPLLGQHNVRNALAAATMALAAGVELPAIAQGLSTVEPVKGRQHVHRLRSGVTLIDDTYNANIGSLYAALDVLALAKQGWLVLGDMHELGGNSAALHAAIGQRARLLGIQRLYTLGALSAAAAKVFGQGAKPFIGDHQALIAQLQYDLEQLGEEDALTVLVKGSRASAMETVVHALLAPQKGEPDAT